MIPPPDSSIPSRRFGPAWRDRHGLETDSRAPQIAIVVALVVALAAGFYWSPLPVADDWTIFYEASNRLLHGQPLFNEVYFNPPHVAILLLPLALLPIRVAYALVNALTLVILVLIAMRQRLDPIKSVVLILSPPLFYTLLHGQIDVLMLAALLLPRTLWGIAALGKPQVAGGLILSAGPKGWLLGAGIVAATFLVYPGWLTDLLRVAGNSVAFGQNVLSGYWPQQLAIAAGLLYAGWRRNDEKFLVAGSPFLLPYAAPSSFIGLWLLVCTKLERGVLLLVWGVWWASILWRAIW